MTLAPSPIPELDDAEWDMISRGDMLGSRLGAKTAATITTLLDKLEAAERERDEAITGSNALLASQNEIVHKITARAEAAEARADKLAAALEPFASFGENNTDDEGWAGTECQRERIVDWFGPSDFRTARSALADKGVANG